MNNGIALSENEKITFELRSLFASYGYAHYKMSKFEEYDLYSKNKDFLVSDGVITFTDTNGKLMALKPDVTLSIVKNTEKSELPVQKLYYDENVYRVSKSTRTFRELMQVGLECIGDTDGFCVFEVLTLALKSLKKISADCILDISDLDILMQVTAYVGIPENERGDILRLVGEKNIHELAAKCRNSGIPEEKIGLLKELVALHGDPETVFPKADALLYGVVDAKKYNEFKETVMLLEDKSVINIDFSVTDDINYYNGIVFKGFVSGVPGSVLSGGRYDALMKKMKRRSGAIGFAVYTDMLERLSESNEKYDADVVLTYGPEDSFAGVQKTAERLRKNGESVLVLKNVPENIRYKRLINYGEGNES